MNDLDVLVMEKLVNMREKILASFAQRHPHISSMLNGVLANKKSKIGMVITENGQLAGEYTLHTEGMHIKSVESGKLSSEVNYPVIGIIRPYALMERSTLEKMLADEKSFEEDPFSTAKGYMPEVTLKFLH